MIGGVPRPTIRKRSSVTGAELWPEGTITLDTREGAVVDVAVLPDGRMWVAMNVRPPGKDQTAADRPAGRGRARDRDRA